MGLVTTIRDKQRNTEQLVFRQLVLQYQALGFPPLSVDKTKSPNSGLREAIEDIINTGKERPLNWLELYDLESMILRVMDDDRLRDESWALRAEFRNLASDDLYNTYMESKPPVNPRSLDVPLSDVRRDIDNLLRKLHELRLGRSHLDVIRAYTTSLTFAVTVILILIPALIVILSSNSSVPVLILVIAGGIFGAGFSMLQRLSQIPTKGDLIARYPAASRHIVWILTPVLSLTQGSLAAIVLYFILRAGLVTGDLFPHFETPSLGLFLKQFMNEKNSTPLQQLLHDRVASVTDGAKLFVWSVIVGTAERLVPDLLTHLADRANKSQSSNKPV